MKTNNISREYKIDYISEKIIVTKKFLKAAGVYNSPEYTEYISITLQAMLRQL